MANEISAGTLLDQTVKDRHIAPGAGPVRANLSANSLSAYVQNLLDLRCHDTPERLLPGPGNVKAEETVAAYRWTPTDADDVFFVADRQYRVCGIRARVEVTGTDGGAVTAVIKKAASATAIASGTPLHTGSINLKGAAATNQAITLSATPADLDIPAGTAIGIDFTGVLTSARGTVSVALSPASSTDDLVIVNGSTGYGTNQPQAQTVDVHSAGSVTKRARMVMALPDLYDAGQAIQIRVNAGMLTTVADTSATIAIEAYQLRADGTLSANLCTTAAQSINSLTLGTKDFVITPTGLVTGNRLDVRVSIAVNDAATGTAVIGVLQDLILRCNTRP